MDFGDPGGGMTGIGEGGGTDNVENGNGNAEGGSEYSADYDGIVNYEIEWIEYCWHAFVSVFTLHINTHGQFSPFRVVVHARERVQPLEQRNW